MRIHSYVSPKCKAISRSSIHRNGVFAVKHIQKGELVAIWGGYVMKSKEYLVLPKNVRRYEYPVSVYDGFYIGPKRTSHLDDAEMFNHSCDPNVGVKGQIVVVARRDIVPGEELCFDYETTDTAHMHFTCRCGSPHCRKVITGNSWKRKAFQRKNRGYFSWYIQQKIDARNRR